MTIVASDAYKRWQKSPILFISAMWGLRSQQILDVYRPVFEKARADNNYDSLRLDMFEPFVWWEMITWQQAEVVYAVMQAVNGQWKRKISIASGHGIGKSTILAMLILWFLFCYMESKVPCTAPTQSQMYDVLWAEIQKWILRMPEWIKELYEFSTDYVRIKQRPETWFARARTGRKENPEALAGLHAPFMLLIVDEASWVPDPIFNSAKSALTWWDTLFMMISNYTRLEGYFHESQTKFREDFKTFSFNSEHSPIVDRTFVNEIIREHGIESDEYKVRVLGKAPRSDWVDEGWYLPLILPGYQKAHDIRLHGEMILGIDPAGEGKDVTQWVLRDQFSARIIAKEKQSTTKSITQTTLTIMQQYGIVADSVIVDNFGVGANVAQEMGLMGHRVRAINVWDKAQSEEYLNLRAELYWKVRLWLLQGGMIDSSPEWDKELPTLKFRRNMQNKVQIMPKDEQRRRGISSQNAADALMLTFIKSINGMKQGRYAGFVREVNDDPY